MYIPYKKVLTVYGSLYGQTLNTVYKEKVIKLPTKTKFTRTITGFINFIREANGECIILRVLEGSNPDEDIEPNE